MSADGTGTFNVAAVGAQVDLGDLGVEGAFYVAAGNPQFPIASVLVADYSEDRIVSFQVNSNGDPVPNTQRDFITEVTGVEGAAVDPLTGDFIFSSFSSGDVWIVGGFGIAAPTASRHPKAAPSLAHWANSGYR